MIQITDTAQAKIQDLLQQQGRGDLALRMQIMGRGPGGFRYGLRFVPESDRAEGDQVVAFEGFNVYIDGASAPKLSGATVDFEENAFQGGFKIDNPNPAWDDPTAQSIQEFIDGQINPGVGAHGGFVTLLDYRDGVAYIAFGGGCQGCGLVDVTLKQGVEVMIKEAIPEVREVVDTTDHTSGHNPFYAAREGDSALS